MELRFGAQWNFWLLRRQDEFSLELSAILLHVLFFLNRRPRCLPGNHAGRARRPRLGIGDEREWPRRDHLQRETLVRPASAERSPLLEVYVGKLPFFHFAHGPVGGLFDVGRIRQPRAVDVREIAHEVHDLRVIEAFVFDLINGVQIRRTGRLRAQRNRGHDQQENQQGFPMLSHIRLQTFCPAKLYLKWK